MSDGKDLKKNKIKIAILGDPSVGKTSFVNNFISSLNDNTNNSSNVVQNQMYKRIEKIIKDETFILDFYEFNTFNDKIISFVQDCGVALIIFDLNNRNTFDSLSDWLRFLKNDFTKDIYLLGNYIGEGTPLTQTEEISEMIIISEMNANYIEIGNKKKNEMNVLVDELILKTNKEEIKNAKTKDNHGNSFKLEKCNIY